MADKPEGSLELDTAFLIEKFVEEIHIFVEGDPRYLSYTNTEKAMFWQIMQSLTDKAIYQSVQTLAIVDQIKTYRKIRKERNKANVENSNEQEAE